jgi:methylthioribose-1-phosphate isomerase
VRRTIDWDGESVTIIDQTALPPSTASSVCAPSTTCSTRQPPSGPRGHPDTGVSNPAFDMTPAELISTIVTENGQFNP